MMNKDEKETRNNIDEVGRDDGNTGNTTNHNFDYIERKPEHSRKALVMLGIALVLALVLVIGGACFVTKNATEAVAQSGLFSTENDEPEEKLFAGAGATDEEIDLESTELAEVLTGDATGDDNTIIVADDGTKPTAYAKVPINFELYEVSSSEAILVEPGSKDDQQDYYQLKLSTVYTIQWDATPLFLNDDGEVDAKITANSDYLIEYGETGIITVTLRDYAAHIDYVGEVKIASIGGNLGIEFCADACDAFMRGSWPYIGSKDRRFDLYFYTTGEYAKHSGIITGEVGRYPYEYNVNGDKTEEYSVTNLIVKPTPMPKPSDTPTPPPTPDSDGAPN